MREHVEGFSGELRVDQFNGGQSNPTYLSSARRLVGILQGIVKRAELGNAASSETVNSGKRTRPLAEQAWRLVESINL